jgi:hypothetical protein
MKEFKGTRGEVFACCIKAKPHFLFTNDGETTICAFTQKQDSGIELPIEEVQANANLIVDAFKVRQSINCELSELLEQRNEMLAMLENYDHYTKKEIEQLIKKVKDNG